MDKRKLKEVTPNGAVRTKDRRHGTRRTSVSESEATFEETSALGLDDEMLIHQTLTSSVDGAEHIVALDEMERRMGWQEAAASLMAAGPEGQSIAEGRWGGWLGSLGAASRHGADSPLQLKRKKRRESAYTLRIDSRRAKAGELSNGGGAQFSPEQTPEQQAREALSSANAKLPHLERIQASFGGHNVMEVQANLGSDAESAAKNLGAEAFASGEAIAFTQAPDLFTAAHEAAHVVQQRGGLQLEGGLGKEGDVHERHADAVAHRVVQGHSAEDLLSVYAPSSGELASPASQKTPLQLMVAQISVNDDDDPLILDVNIVGRPPPSFGNSMGDHSTAFVVQVANVRRRLQGVTLVNGILNMDTLIGELDALPGMALVEGLPGRQKDRLLTAFATMNSIRDQLPSAPVLRGEAVPISPIDPITVPLRLQELVTAYLEARELVPLSTTNVFAIAPALAGKGKGESGHARVLQAFQDGDMESSPEDLRAAITGLLDVDSVAMVAAEVDGGNLAKLSPGLTLERGPLDRMSLMVGQHLESVGAAFPRVQEALFSDKNEATKVLVLALAPRLLGQWTATIDRINRKQKNLKDQIERQRAELAVTSGRAFKRKELIGLLIGRLIAEGTRLEEQKVEIRRLLAENAPPDVGGMDSADIEESMEAESSLDEIQVELIEDEGESSDEGESIDGDEANDERQEAESSSLATQLSMEGGRITDMDFAGRTASPIPGSMGAHTTAWVAHLDHLRAALMGKTLAESIQHIKTVLGPEMKAAGAALLKHFPLNEHHQALLEHSEASLDTAIANAESAKPIAQALALQNLIGSYLTYVNFQPGATLDAANTDGHGEAAHRRVLRDYEHTGEGATPAELNRAIAGLFDVDDAVAPEAVQALWEHHLVTCKSAYPRSVDKSTVKKSLGSNPHGALQKLAPAKKLVKRKKRKLGAIAPPLEAPGPDLVGADGGILVAAQPTFILAYRQDVRASNAYLNEADGHLLAQNLGISVAVYRGAVPEGFRAVDCGGGGNCLIHSLVAAQQEITGNDARGATGAEIAAARGVMADNLDGNDILASCAAAVFAQLIGAGEFGLGPNMRALLQTPSLQKVKADFVPFEASKDSSSSAPSKAEVGKGKMEAEGADVGALATFGDGATHDRVAILHTGGNHYVLLIKDE